MPSLSAIRRRRLGIAAALTLIALGVAAAAQEEPPPPPAETAPDSAPEEEFFETVNVEVVSVDVVVTEKNGKRVRGLTKDDFELSVDGRPVEITNFYAVEDGAPAAPLEMPEALPSAPAPGQPPPAPGTPPAPQLPEEQRLLLVVYVDNFNIRPFNRNRVLREVRQFLTSNLRRGDQVMLVSYDRSLHVRRTFTYDPTVIASASFELETMTGHQVHTDSDRRDILRAIEDAEYVGEVAGRVRSYAESLFNDLSFTISALREFVDGLAGLPGRKAILYVSDGIPMRAGEDVYIALQEKFREQVSLLEVQDFDASRRYRELVAAANANRVTFYTIDAAGLRVSSSVSAENQGPGFGPFVDSAYQSNLQAPLQMLAEGTGGRAVINSNRVLPALERIAEDFGNYYSLGYMPAHGGDGRYHRFRVRTQRKGLRVEHRDGYRDKPIEQRMSEATLAALTYGFESNPLAIVLETGSGKRRDDGLYLVPLLVKVPLGKLVLVPRGTVHEARLRLFVAAVDDEGNTSEVQRVPVPIRVPGADLEVALTQHYAYQVQLLMRPGSQRAAVGVRDELAGTSSIVYRALTVGSRG